MFAAAFNLLIGYTGLLSFGHAMFLASAGYTAGYAIQTLGFTPELGVIAGTAVATLLGLIVGLFAIRRQGIYFAMVTLALAQKLKLEVLAEGVETVEQQEALEKMGLRYAQGYRFSRPLPSDQLFTWIQQARS